MIYCRVCQGHKKPNHHCYVTQYKEKRCDTYDNGENMVVAYDLETSVQDDQTLTSTLAVVQLNESEVHSFWSNDEKTAADLLLKFLIERSASLNNGVKIIALAHNARYVNNMELWCQRQYILF